MATVLVVDDSRFMRMMLKQILSEEGHQVVAEAENAADAIEQYRELTPDLVTLDVVLPDDGGPDSRAALGAMIATNPAANVVMVSGLDQEQVASEFRAAGAKGFITKPFEPSQVAEIVTEVLGA